jgi:hypothetical protein
MADALHTPGVVSAQDARLADAGLIAVQGPSAIDVRTGVLPGPNYTALVVGTTATAPMTVQIRTHHWITSRGAANGPYRGSNELTRTVSIAAAPGSNSRIDVVYVKMQDATPGVPSPDATSGELYGVVTGTADVSPTKPALPVGALELATVTVAAGATNTAGAGVTIAQTARLTALRGTRVPVRNQADRDALTPYAGLEVYRLDNGRVELSNGGAWATLFDPATLDSDARYIAATGVSLAISAGGSGRTIPFGGAVEKATADVSRLSGNAVFTLNRSGLWQIGFTVRVASVTAGTTIIAYLSDDTGSVIWKAQTFSAGGSVVPDVSVPPIQKRFDAGQRISAWVFSSTATSIDNGTDGNARRTSIDFNFVRP